MRNQRPTLLGVAIHGMSDLRTTVLSLLLGGISLADTAVSQPPSLPTPALTDGVWWTSQEGGPFDEAAYEFVTRFQYAGGDVNLLAGVFRQATGMHADAFAAAHLFGPMEITEVDWSTWGKREGYPNLSGSLLLLPRDMAKLGLLVLQSGRWQDRH